MATPPVMSASAPSTASSAAGIEQFVRLLVLLGQLGDLLEVEHVEAAFVVPQSASKRPAVRARPIP